MAGKIWRGLSGAAVAVLAALAVLLVGVRLFGLTPYVVLSGSMEPAYPTGSLIYVRRTDPQTVEVGTPITFVLNADLQVATHRVTAVDPEREQFRTKGDANDAEDGSPVHFNNLIGVPVFCIPLLGYAAHFISAPPGLYLAASFALALLVLLFLPDRLKPVEGRRKVRQAARTGPPGRQRQA